MESSLCFSLSAWSDYSLAAFQRPPYPPLPIVPLFPIEIHRVREPKTTLLGLTVEQVIGVKPISPFQASEYWDWFGNLAYGVMCSIYSDDPYNYWERQGKKARSLSCWMWMRKYVTPRSSGGHLGTTQEGGTGKERSCVLGHSVYPLDQTFPEVWITSGSSS